MLKFRMWIAESEHGLRPLLRKVLLCRGSLNEQYLSDFDCRLWYLGSFEHSFFENPTVKSIAEVI